MFEVASVKTELCIFLQENSRENDKDISTMCIEELFLEKKLMIDASENRIMILNIEFICALPGKSKMAS